MTDDVGRSAVAAYLNRVLERHALGELCTVATVARIAMVLPCYGPARARDIVASGMRFEVRGCEIVEVL